jgi:aminoglycoside phosphotransferase (APT) family kinase protein
VSAPIELGHAWLPAVLPAGAGRVRVDDAALRGTLAFAGAQLVDEAPDAEIARHDRLRGDADVAVIPVDTAYVYARSRAARAARRALRTLVVRSRGRGHAGQLRAAGYERICSIPWDLRQPAAFPGLTRAAARSAAELLPQRLLVVGQRGPSRPTLLEAALADFEAATGRTAPRVAALVSGSLTLVGESVVLRVALGEAERLLTTAAHALEQARAGPAAGVLAALSPAPVGHGRVGLAAWSAEERLPGDPCPPRPSPALTRACLDALAALWDASADRSARSSPARDAAVVAAVPGVREGERLLAIGRRVEETLRESPRGFVHGDFWTGNLLAREDRLVGLIDWEAAGPGRLPLADLFQFRLNAQHPHSDLDWGRVLVERLLPELRTGGDIETRAFCARIGIEPEPRRLEALAAAYWLDRVAYQLGTYAERRLQPLFLAGNVDLVARALS